MRRIPIIPIIPLCTLTVIASLSAGSAHAQSKPLRVFILAGQSNMEGHAKVETFDYIGDDPATAPLLKQMRAADGKSTVCDGAWISYFPGVGDNNGEGFGKLTAGYGSRQRPDPLSSIESDEDGADTQFVVSFNSSSFPFVSTTNGKRRPVEALISNLRLRPISAPA